MYNMPKRYGKKSRSTLVQRRRKFGGRKSGRRRQPAKVAKRGLPKRQTLQSSLGGLTLTRFVAARRPGAVASHIKKVGAPNSINITYPGVMASAGGLQANSSWYLNAGNDLRRIWAIIQGLFVNKNATTSAERVSDVDGGVPTKVLNATFRFVLETATSMLNIANTTGTPVNLELYDIVAKRDSPQLPLDFVGNLATGGGKYAQGTLMMDPGIAWSVGMKNEFSDATGFELVARGVDTDPNQLGATPYQSKLFKDYFKVTRKTNISLPIGGQHKHYVDLKPNAVIDNDMLQQNQVYKGLSFFTLVVASGVPVVKCPVEGQPLGNPDGDATTSAVSLSIIQQVRYKWTWVEDSRENIYRANYINTENMLTAQSVQPAMTKVTDADIKSQIANLGGSYIFTNLPTCTSSEVTVQGTSLPCDDCSK